MNFKFSITGEHFIKLALVRLLDVDDNTSLLEFLIGGQVGQELLGVNKVLGERLQSSSFPFPENKVSLKVKRPIIARINLLCTSPLL